MGPPYESADPSARRQIRRTRVQAALVRRHGVYVWGEDWVQAKTHAECYDFLFEAAVRMRQLGIDPSAAPAPSLAETGS